MLDETLDTAETFSQREQVTALQHVARVINRTPQHRGYDPAIPPDHLTLRERMLRMAFESRIVDALDPGMLFQELRNGQRVGAMALHAQCQSLDSSQDQKAIKRPSYRAHRILQVRQAIPEPGVGADHRH